METIAWGQNPAKGRKWKTMGHFIHAKPVQRDTAVSSAFLSIQCCHMMMSRSSSRYTTITTPPFI